MAELASALFGRSRLETHVSDGSQTSTVYGKATSDSDGGKVNVVLGDAVTADGGTNAVELATTTSVKSGDNVIVTLVGGDAGKHPIVTGVVGRGDEQQAQMEAEAVARQSAIDQKADEITASVAESYATKDALNGEVTSRESIVRQTTNGVEVAKKVNGAYTGTKAVIDDDSFDIQGQDGTVYSSFGASKVELGKDSAASVIDLCNGNGRISTADTWTSIESPKTGNLELKSGVGTEQQAFVRVSGGDRPQISLARTDGIADADSVIQMSSSGITIDGGERGVTTGRIKLGGGTMLKAVYCGSTVVYVDQIGNAKLLSGKDYGTKGIGWSNLFVSSGDHNALFGSISAVWANDGSGDWWVHTSTASKNVRVNWTLFVW